MLSKFFLSNSIAFVEFFYQIQFCTCLSRILPFRINFTVDFVEFFLSISIPHWYLLNSSIRFNSTLVSLRMLSKFFLSNSILQLHFYNSSIRFNSTVVFAKFFLSELIFQLLLQCWDALKISIQLYFRVRRSVWTRWKPLCR